MATVWVAVLGTKRFFLTALDSATQSLSEKIEQTEEKVTSVLRQELRAADQVLRGDLDKLHQKIDATHQKLESVQAGAPSAEVMERLEAMSKKIDARDWISEAWQNPANINLRQIVSWIMRTSLDTRNELGLTPLVTFLFFPGREPTEENHLTALDKALIRMLLLHQDKFTPALQRGIQTQTEKTITPVFKCVQIEPSDASRVAGLFPVEPFKQANGNCFVFRTKDLVRMMREERSYMERDEIVLPASADLQVDSRVDLNGKMQIQEGGGIENLKKARAVKIRTLVGLDIPSLHAFAKERLRTEDGVEMLKYLAVRRLWNMPASKEYLAQVGSKCLLLMVWELMKRVFSRRSVWV